MKALTTVLAGSALALACTLAHAQAVGTVAGLGLRSCGLWLDARKQKADGPTQAHERFSTVWVQGFLSGLNVESLLLQHGGVLLPDPQTIQFMLDNECKEKPQQSVDQAAQAMFIKLRESNPAK
ncbi:MAG: hypothetical protein EON54_05385 [Alcaligenaceae bacterium]|nr:MAG: hypothetical protein EON54_05385 [Alcaligenaceae bacterium]